MMLRNWRKVLGATTVVLGMTVPILTISGEVVHAAGGNSDCAPIATTALSSLCVESSSNGPNDPPYNTGVLKGDRVDEFKWLVNEDDSTGDPSFTAASVADCLPARAKPTAAEAATNPVLAMYSTAGDGNLADCPWPSVHSSTGHSTVIASGDQTNAANIANLASLGNHKYLISVTAVGYKIDGVHFEVRAGQVYSVNEEVGKDFIVRMNPLPKKTSTLRVHVFNDNASTNSQWDGQTETLLTCDVATPQQVAANCGGSTDPNLVADPTTDMSGFSVHIADVLGETTTDVYGSPLCTQYQTDAFGNVLLNDDGTPNALVFGDGGASGGALSGTESTCVSDHYGDIVIPNMGPNRYAVTVVPPDPRTHNDDVWMRTTTLEGGHDWDSWLIEGSDGYDTELIVGGERIPPIVAGFVKLTHNDQVWADAEAAGRDSAAEKAYYDASAGFLAGSGTGQITGTLMVGRAYIGSGGATPLAGTNLANAKADGVIEDGVVSVSCIATCNAPTDSVVWVGRARTDGTFDVNHLQTGDYVVSFWDEQQSHILAAMQYHVTSGETTDVGDILLPGWFTDLQGVVFNDLDGDGFRDPGEPGVPDFTLGERTRGNSLQDQGQTLAVTNDKGEYDMSQGYPLGQYLIIEGYNPRYKNTGYTYTSDNDPIPHTVSTAQVDIAFNPVIGLSGRIDWGVQAYGTGTDYWSGDGVTPAPKNENGGIVGTVTYDVTRNEFDPAFSAQEDYQPGVSGISMQLWKTHKADGIHADTYPETGAVQQWGITAAGLECMRDDTSRGSNAVMDASQPCKPYDYYVTESFQRPVGCKALDVNGNHLEGELALPDAPAVVDYSHNPDVEGLTPEQSADCLDAPMESMQIGGNGTVDGNYALTSLIKPETLAVAPAGGPGLEAVYADSQNNPDASMPLDSGDYVVEAVNPVDDINASTTSDPNVGGYTVGGTAKRLYRFTDETSINVMTGDSYVPRGGYGSTGEPDGGGYALAVTADSPIRYDHNSLGAGTVALCAGSLWAVPEIGAGQDAVNPDLNAGGGNPYGGRDMPICDAKLVSVAGGRSMPAGFSMFTDVPLPAKFYGLVNDDLNVNTDRRSIMLGEVAPASNVPVGIYDENGNWKLTAHSDVNGFYEVLLPSTDTYNCPLPAGPCPNVYRLVGNDPGTLAHRNTDYNAQFRTIATEFQAWPGVVHPVDQAPTHVGITIEGPAAQFGALSLCKLDVANPMLFAIDKPYFDPAADSSHNFVIKGSGFGLSPGVLRLGSTTITGANLVSWTDTQITFKVPAAITPGPYQLSITNTSSGLSTVNGLTFHHLAPNSGTGSTAYIKKGDVYEVTPAINTDNAGARQYSPVHDAWDAATNTPVGFFGVDVNGATVGDANNTGVNSPNGRAIQRAVQAAYNSSNNGNNAKLVVIYPNTAGNYAAHNPFAAYFENVVLHGKVKLQGVGPGGATSSTDIVNGTNIDASSFWSATQVVPPGGNQDSADGSYSDDWRTWANGIARVGSTAGTELPEGSAVTAVAQAQNQYGGTNAPSSSTLFRSGVDGILLTGGDQQGNPGNINTSPGTQTDAVPGPTNPGPSQGGAITTDQYVRDFNITNNQIQSNGGTYGTVRIGTPDLPGNANATSNHNDRVNVANNRLVANAGTNLAGALGLFAGANNYTVTGNDFCGNFSAEYGGAISHYGRSDSGNITRNRIYYNQGYDEGGGIMVAGALPANNNALSPGAGVVTIDGNTLISNQSNDDGGGLRFLMAGNFAELVENNIIANNLSTHEGAGVALDDSTNVTLVNNTIVKNITTATAATNAALSDGIKPANPAGLSSGGNSALLQASLANNSPNWSKPRLLNNIFADNRAGWAVLPSVVNFNESAIHGIGDPADSVTTIQRWDVGVSSTSGLCNSWNRLTNVCNSPFAFNGASNTTNALTTANLAHIDGGYSYVAAGTSNIAATIDGTVPVVGGGIGFVNPQDFVVDSLMWRVNTNVSFPVLVAHMVPVNLLANYHLTTTSSTTLAINAGAASYNATQPNATVNAPNHDIDNEGRPSGAYERGADELFVPNTVDLAVTKADGVTTVNQGAALTYTIVVSNAGSNTATNAQITDTMPTQLQNVSWTCATTGAATCGGSANSTGNISRLLTVPVGATVTFTVHATVRSNATGTVANTVAVTKGAADIEPNTANNSVTDTDTIHTVGGDLVVTKTANKATVPRSGNAAARTVLYTVTLTNSAGADTATGARFNEATALGLSFNSWTCTATAGSSCGVSNGSGRPSNRSVTIAGGGTVTFVISATLTNPFYPSIQNWPVINVVTLAAPAGFTDPTTSNNLASNTVTVTA
jgi:uncharacterized repeat protein (TIGR01451 family)